MEQFDHGTTSVMRAKNIEQFVDLAALTAYANDEAGP
jgi:hypothetical protein